MRTIRTFVKRYALLVFFGITFAIAIPMFVPQTPDTPIVFVLLLLMLGSYGPAVAALAVLNLSQDAGGWQALRSGIGTHTADSLRRIRGNNVKVMDGWLCT